MVNMVSSMVAQVKFNVLVLRMPKINETHHFMVQTQDFFVG